MPDPSPRDIRQTILDLIRQHGKIGWHEIARALHPDTHRARAAVYRQLKRLERAGSDSTRADRRRRSLQHRGAGWQWRKNLARDCSSAIPTRSVSLSCAARQDARLVGLKGRRSQAQGGVRRRRTQPWDCDEESKKSPVKGEAGTRRSGGVARPCLPRPDRADRVDAARTQGSVRLRGLHPGLHTAGLSAAPIPSSLAFVRCFHMRLACLLAQHKKRKRGSEYAIPSPLAPG